MLQALFNHLVISADVPRSQPIQRAFRKFGHTLSGQGLSGTRGSVKQDHLVLEMVSVIARWNMMH